MVQLRNLIRDLPEGDPSRNAALVFAESKGLTADDVIYNRANVTEIIKREFATLPAQHYYTTTGPLSRSICTIIPNGVEGLL